MYNVISSLKLLHMSISYFHFFSFLTPLVMCMHNKFNTKSSLRNHRSLSSFISFFAVPKKKPRSRSKVNHRPLSLRESGWRVYTAREKTEKKRIGSGATLKRRRKYSTRTLAELAAANIAEVGSLSLSLLPLQRPGV